MTTYLNYRKSKSTEMTRWVTGFDMEGVSIADTAIAKDSPKDGDMIARDPNNHDDRWLVDAAYFKANYDLTSVEEAESKG